MSLSPPFLQLGSGAGARVTVRGPAGVTGLHLSVSAGEVGEVRELEPGVYEADFLPPKDTYPRVALVAAWAQQGNGVVHGFAPLALWGQGLATVTTRPLAQVTLRIGDRDFGPVQADAKGQGELQVQVPPGTTHAMHGPKAIDLGLPVTSRLHVVAIPPVAPADAPCEVTLRVYSVSALGELEPAAVRLLVPEGHVGPLKTIRPGVAEATWRLPALEPHPLLASAWSPAAKGAPAATAGLRISGGPITSVVLLADRPGYTAGAGRTIDLRARLRDAKGRPTEGPVQWASEFGTLEVGPLVAGEARAQLRVPDRFEGRERLLVSVRAGGRVAQVPVRLEPGAPSDVKLPPPQPLRARESVLLRGAIVDGWGNPVAMVPSATAERGAVAVVSSDRTGFVLQFTAPSTRSEEPAQLRVSFEELSRRHTIQVTPRPSLFTVSLKAGYATNFGVVSAPLGGLELGAWTELAHQHLGLLLEGGVLSTASSLMVDAQRALTTHTTFVPVLLSAALDLRLGRDAWLRPAVGGGVSALFHGARLGDQPWVEESALGAAAQLSLQAGWRAGVGAPFIELRGLWVSNPGLTTLQGSLFSLTAAAGYSFDVL